MVANDLMILHTSYISWIQLPLTLHLQTPCKSVLYGEQGSKRDIYSHTHHTYLFLCLHCFCRVDVACQIIAKLGDSVISQKVLFYRTQPQLDVFDILDVQMVSMSSVGMSVNST